MTKNPKYYEMGTIIDHGFLGKKKGSKRAENTGSLFDEIAAKDEQIGFTKRKFVEIQKDKMKSSRNKRFIKLKRDILKGKTQKARSQNQKKS